MFIARIPYRQKITIIILIFAILPFFLINLFYFRINWNAKVEEIIGKYRSQVQAGADNVNNIYLAASMQKLAYISSNYEINRFLQGDYDEDLLSMISFYQNSKRIVFDAINADHLISGITVYTFNPSIISENFFKKFEDSDIYKNNETELKNRILNRSNPSNVSWKIKTETTETGAKTYLSLYRQIASLNKPLGIAEIKLDFDSIMKQFQFDIPEKSFIAYGTDDESKIILVNGNKVNQDEASKSAVGHLTENKRNFYEISAGFINKDKIFMFIPRGYILHTLSAFVFESLLVFAAFIVAVFITTKIVSQYLTRRLSFLIKRVDSDFERLDNGKELRISQKNDEFDRIDNKLFELTQKIKEYYQKINDYEIEHKTIELEKKALELDLLQARINPHFLYNTLSVIRHAFQNKKLEQVIESLSRYYRIALNQGDNIIKVYQETDMAEEYFKIQKFSYLSDFEYDIDVDETIREKSILKHLLQPIVENAFVHGVCSRERGGRIRITGIREEGKIIFQVADNGLGMDQEKVERILRGENVSLVGGYGLKNVKSRIEAYYGEDYGVNVASVIDEGTVVTVTIPDR